MRIYILFFFANHKEAATLLNRKKIFLLVATKRVNLSVWHFFANTKELFGILQFVKRDAREDDGQGMTSCLVHTQTRLWPRSSGTHYTHCRQGKSKKK